MQKRQSLQFSCQGCKNPVRFSVFELESRDSVLSCTQCPKKYAFTDEVLKRQLRKFDALCRQIVESEEILSQTAVGIDIGEHHVRVPYKILLTRLNSYLDLMIGDEPVSICFRIEPVRDLPIPTLHQTEH